MKKLLITLATLALVACSSGEEDPTLSLAGFDIQPEDYRQAIQDLIAEDPFAAAMACGLLEDRTPEKQKQIIEALSDDTAPTDLPAGAVAKPDQEADESDAAEAIEILVSECDRL